MDSRPKQSVRRRSFDDEHDEFQDTSQNETKMLQLLQSMMLLSEQKKKDPIMPQTSPRMPPVQSSSNTAILGKDHPRSPPSIMPK